MQFITPHQKQQDKPLFLLIHSITKLLKIMRIATVSALLTVLSGCAVPILDVEPEKTTVNEDLQQVFKKQAPITSAITLDEAIARAIQYNLNNQVSRMEEALQYGMRKQAKYDMLPQLTAQAGYNLRNNEDGSISKVLTGANAGLVTEDYSTSVDKGILTNDLQLVWNFLDFGVAYLNAQDQDQRFIITTQQRRKSIQNLTTQVQTAYWKAVAAQTHLPRIRKLIQQAQTSLNQSRKMEVNRVQPPLEALNYQQTLLESLESLTNLSNDLERAKQELGQMINLPPGTHYELADQSDAFSLQQLAPSSLFPDNRVVWMEEEALEKNADLWKSDKELALSSNAIRQELFSLFPGVTLQSGAHTTSNFFTYNPAWMNVGLSLAWNVFNVISAPERINNAKQRHAIARMKRMTTAMSILAQVHLSRQEYYNRYEKLRIADELLRIQQSKTRITQAQLQADTGTQQQQTQADVNTLFAEIKRDLAYAETYNALGQIYHTLGFDPVSHDIADSDLTTLTHFIRAQRGSNHYKILHHAKLDNPDSDNTTTDKGKRKPPLLRPNPYAIQIGIYQTRETARVQAIELRRQGYSPTLWKEYWDDGSIWYHVLLGRYRNKAMAEMLSSDLAHRQNIPSTVIKVPAS